MTGAITPIEEPVRNMDIARGRTRGVSTISAFRRMCVRNSSRLTVPSASSSNSSIKAVVAFDTSSCVGITFDFLPASERGPAGVLSTSVSRPRTSSRVSTPCPFALASKAAFSSFSSNWYRPRTLNNLEDRMGATVANLRSWLHCSWRWYPGWGRRSCAPWCQGATARQTVWWCRPWCRSWWFGVDGNLPRGSPRWLWLWPLPWLWPWL
mmetsp:Transcript_105375/g.304146  ORF Transcript_105375/g.304146 Transcript_105375/m.304146 type:complete len:209 (-) Transcript_105375:439-1065(-)